MAVNTYLPFEFEFGGEKMTFEIETGFDILKVNQFVNDFCTMFNQLNREKFYCFEIFEHHPVTVGNSLFAIILLEHFTSVDIPNGSYQEKYAVLNRLSESNVDWSDILDKVHVHTVNALRDFLHNQLSEYTDHYKQVFGEYVKELTGDQKTENKGVLKNV